MSKAPLPSWANHGPISKAAVNTEPPRVNTRPIVLTSQPDKGIFAPDYITAEQIAECARHVDRHKPGYMAAYMRKRRAKL